MRVYHQRCRPQRTGHSASTTSSSSSSQPHDSTKSHRQPFTFTLHRDSLAADFGFVLCGSCPSRIGKVTKRRVGAEAVRAGDSIVAVNGVNVSRASLESVVKLIKASKLKLVLDVLREVNKTTKHREVSNEGN